MAISEVGPKSGHDGLVVRKARATFHGHLSDIDADGRPPQGFLGGSTASHCRSWNLTGLQGFRKCPYLSYLCLICKWLWMYVVLGRKRRLSESQWQDKFLAEAVRFWFVPAADSIIYRMDYQWLPQIRKWAMVCSQCTALQIAMFGIMCSLSLHSALRRVYPEVKPGTKKLKEKARTRLQVWTARERDEAFHAKQGLRQCLLAIRML